MNAMDKSLSAVRTAGMTAARNCPDGSRKRKSYGQAYHRKKIYSAVAANNTVLEIRRALAQRRTLSFTRKSRCLGARLT